ncbi:ThiF family adenylyltransferase [Streptomyces sp. NBC_01485]|uniref:ThiF family adenylyltransferase n=1 Tax=Streptomyces sp. NBC_01485 TaxID=2903884 RepID=UPI002E355CEB|nr:ThiF family adenylyltransferase [Streptomyces sp. NBC_01485]
MASDQGFADTPDMPGPVDFGAEAVSRNLGILSDREQAALRAATVLVAGCGSVGGAVVEPLVRLGVNRFRLADPDRFDVSNLNRQACVVEDVGKAKPEVLARRVQAINPCAEVRVYAEGLTLENLDEALDGAHIAFDAIDPAMSSWVKYQLHAGAARRGIPVVAGVDWGGKPAVFVFDYRRNPVPFHGKATAESHRENRLWDSVRWFGRTHFPTDYLPVLSDRLENGGTWPQISYCVMAMGALSSRVIVDLLMNRRVRPVVTVDLHAAAMPWTAAVVYRARMPLELARTLRTIRRVTRSGGASQPVVSGPERRRLPQGLVPLLEGARLAPSPYNSQPWHFDILDDKTIGLAPQTGRWPAAAPDRLGWAEALGCALAAMSVLAHGDWEPSASVATRLTQMADGPSDSESDTSVGRFHLDRLRGGVLIRQGVLGLRSTHRGDMLRTPIENTTAKLIEKLCVDRKITLDMVTGAAALDRMARAEHGALTAIDPGRTEEVWTWLRERARTPSGRGSFGAAHDLFATAGVTGFLARAVDGVSVPRQVAGRTLIGAVARERARLLRHCGAVLVLRGPRRTVGDRIRAGESLMHVWLALVENGYAAQPLRTEFSPLPAPSAFGLPGDDQVLAVLRVGRAIVPPAAKAVRCPVESSVRWLDQTADQRPADHSSRTSPGRPYLNP